MGSVATHRCVGASRGEAAKPSIVLSAVGELCGAVSGHHGG